MNAPRFQVVAVELYERPVRLRMPFRFGVVTLTAAPQAFVRARIRLEDGREGWGAGAEMLAPKWFDKNLALSNEDNFEQLRDALRLARKAYLDSAPRSAFGHFAAHYREVIDAGARHDLNPLVACVRSRAARPRYPRRALPAAAYVVLRGGAGQLGRRRDRRARPDLSGVRHRRISRTAPTGGVDRGAAHGRARRRDRRLPGQFRDGLPESLEEVVAVYGHTWFKLKVGGKVDEDVARLTEIAAVLDASGRPYRVSLDGNEQYDDLEALQGLLARMNALPKLAGWSTRSPSSSSRSTGRRARARRFGGVDGDAGDH